ncbi:MAG: TetR/AcrR family transcriptional regulator [Planctomycetota bacterium]|jgi:AcrR family transcriptional regulator
MSPKGRLGASSERRRQILDAALPLFLEAGVGNCRVEDLFERSGASVGSFYHHFGSKPELAAALYLEILAKFHADFLAELGRHRSARAGIRALVGHHLHWVAADPQRAAYLFHCLEPEVFAVCRDEQNRMTTAFFARCLTWLNERAAAGQLRKLSPLEYYVLWMGPTLELARAWLMNVREGWSWMGAEQRRPEALLGAEKTLADAAWQTLRARE